MHKLLVNDFAVNFYKIIIYLHVINSIFLPSRYFYKNSIPQQSGWNKDVIDWCRKEAERLKLKSDYWGGLIFDEMKIQVKICYF